MRGKSSVSRAERCGKSTTMNIITGYLPATEGSVKVAGFDILEEPEEVKKNRLYAGTASGFQRHDGLGVFTICKRSQIRAEKQAKEPIG